MCPFFRDPSTGKEIIYTEAHLELTRVLRECGLEELAHGAHSLRIGGATALGSDPSGCDFIAGCTGLWRSDSRLKYLWSMRERVESAGYSIGRAVGGCLDVHPGPLPTWAWR